MVFKKKEGQPFGLILGIALLGIFFFFKYHSFHLTTQLNLVPLNMINQEGKKIIFLIFNKNPLNFIEVYFAQTFHNIVVKFIGKI